MTEVAENRTPIRWQHYTGIFLISLATLLLELALTRVLSVANWYHFGFLVISTALLGDGASGVALSIWTKLREEMPLDLALTSLALIFAFVTLASFWLMQRIPFQPFSLLFHRSELVYGLLYFVVLAAPFFCSGLAVSLLLSRGGRKVNRLYAADLVGAGLGCAAVCGTMPVFGGSGSVAVAAFLGALAALAFSSFRLSKLTLFGGVAAVGMLSLAFVAEHALPIRVIPEKHNHPLFPAGRSPIYTKWNAFSKIDVYEAPAPDESRSDSAFYSIIIDGGTAGTGIVDLSKGVRNYLAHSPQYHPAGVEYVGKEHPKVLIIGPGAGREVLEALYFSATSITAVEINPIITDIVSRRLREHWGGLYEQPEVRLVTDDGRSFVRHSKEKYDAIISVNTYSQTALTSGALTLSESYILTREAFEDYWNHLTPSGTLLVMGYNIGKLLATTREMFDHLGLGSPAGHVFAYRGLGAPFGHTRMNIGLVIQKSPLGTEEVDAMAMRAGIGSQQDWGNEGQPEIYYSPFAKPTKGPQTFFASILKAPDLEMVYGSTSEYLRPATDDRPFFNQTERWSRHLGFRRVLSAGAEVMTQPVAQVILVILLLQAVAVAGVLILLPLAWFERKGLQARGCWRFLAYFASLGLGFILIEIVLLQRFQLFLGEPIYTFSIVLSSLLIFTGVGSYLAGRVEDLSRDRLTWFLLVLVGTILLTLAVMPGILSLALGLALPLRVAIAISLVAPLGMLLGVPFPTGLRIVGEQASPLVPWAWAVNGFFTVIGSVAAMILGMVVGFTYVLVIAAGCYATALIAIRGVQPHGVALAEVHTGKPHAERLARLRAPDTVG
jgi:predicted membrane-bound spermidine synthase